MLMQSLNVNFLRLTEPLGTEGENRTSLPLFHLENTQPREALAFPQATQFMALSHILPVSSQGLPPIFSWLCVFPLQLAGSHNSGSTQIQPLDPL